MIRIIQEIMEGQAIHGIPCMARQVKAISSSTHGEPFMRSCFLLLGHLERAVLFGMLRAHLL